jgi:26S proteasome regulatory subunit N6
MVVCFFSLRLTKIYASARQFQEVMSLMKNSNSLFNAIPKAKTAKIVRTILDIVGEVPESLDIQVDLCREVIDWCKAEKRTFLRQRVESKLAVLLWTRRESTAALALVTTLLSELKKLDDKQMLTETHLVESRIHHSLENVPKAKAALTASRTAANSIYVTPLLQAELDEMSGTLQCEEGDSTTAYSYFLEAFDAYDKIKDSRAMACLKYMCLCKVLSNSAGEVPSILANKSSIKYLGEEIEAMSAVARAAKDRSLEQFQAAVSKYAQYLKPDDLISHHLDILFEKMLESNLLKIISPFSCVEVSRVAELIKMPVVEVEKKLSQMILDRLISGILDQGKGHLIVFEPTKEDGTFSKGSEILTNVGMVVEALAGRAKGLNKVSVHVAAAPVAKAKTAIPAK